MVCYIGKIVRLEEPATAFTRKGTCCGVQQAKVTGADSWWDNLTFCSFLLLPVGLPHREHGLSGCYLRRVDVDCEEVWNKVVSLYFLRKAHVLSHYYGFIMPSIDNI
jgi:hypothetical protein